ncbi:hypothetical protein U3516DRAFT_664841 [Neocallimastix sp. 'constans']
MENFIGSELYTKKGIGAFALNQESKIKLKNIELNSIGGGNVGGVLFTSYEEEIGSYFKVTNGTFIEFNQENKNPSSTFIYVNKNINVTLNDCNIRNIRGITGYFIYNKGNTNIKLNNVSVEDYISQKETILFRSESTANMEKTIIKFDNGEIFIKDSMFLNIYYFTVTTDANYVNDYYYVDDSCIMDIGSGTNLYISNSNFNSIHGFIGFKSSKNTNINIVDSVIEETFFKNGLISIDSISRFGYYTIDNTEFNSNTADNGPIVNIIDINSKSKVIFNDSTFYDNSALYYGGVIFSLIKLYDDYGNDIKIYSLEGDSVLSRIIFFITETDDPNNAIISGQPISYCWEDICRFPVVKVIGNPGNYKLRMKLITYGTYAKFDNNSINIDMVIEECDTNNYINQDKDNIGFKSCYLPTCDPACNNGGECANINICNCTNTKYKGALCDEHYKLEKVTYFDNIMAVISLIIILISVFLIAGIMKFKKYQAVKSGFFINLWFYPCKNI